MAIEPTQEEISRVQNHLHIKRYENGKSGRHAVADCPICGKKEHLTLNVETGYWDCKRCEKSGALWSLATALNIRLREKRPVVTTPSAIVRKDASIRPPAKATNAPGITPERVAESCERLFSAEDQEGSRVLAYLRTRGFSDEAIRRFKLGAAYIYDRDDEGKSISELAVAIPYLQEGKVPLVKLRNLAVGKEGRKFRRTKGSESLLFNAEGVKDCASVVLCEGELDAVSLWQFGVTAVVATSLGAKKDIPEEWVQHLAHADDVVLFYDGDDAGQDAVQMLVGRLGAHRTRIARIPEGLAKEVEQRTGKRPKDANDLLVAGVSEMAVRAIISNAQLIENIHVTKPSAFNEMLRDLIHQGEASLGHPCAYSTVHALLRGWREREMTLVTGHSGHGKSTEMLDIADMNAAGQMSAEEEWVRRPQPTLVLSLENGPFSVAQMLFQRKLGRPISSLRSETDKELGAQILDRMDENPLYIMTLEGVQPMALIEEHLRYAVKRYGIKAFLFDHGHYVELDDRKDYHIEMKRVVQRAKALARELCIHIWFLMHPKTGIEETTIVSGEDIRGGSSIKQEADNGVTIWRLREFEGAPKQTRKLSLRDPNKRKFEIEMAKNNCLFWVWKKRHHDAREGVALFDFDTRSLTYREIKPVGKEESTEAPAPDRHAGINDEDDPFTS